MVDGDESHGIESVKKYLENKSTNVWNGVTGHRWFGHYKFAQIQA